MEFPRIAFTFQSGMICRGVSGSVTGCVWCRGRTASSCVLAYMWRMAFLWLCTYVIFVSLSYFHLSNSFQIDLSTSLLPFPLAEMARIGLMLVVGVMFTSLVGFDGSMTAIVHSENAMYEFQVVYVVAIFPYILITVMLVFSCTLEGAGKGIEFYIKPDLNRLTDVEVRLPSIPENVSCGWCQHQTIYLDFWHAEKIFAFSIVFNTGWHM